MSNRNSKETPNWIPTTHQEMDIRGWDRLDVILVSGDTHIDCPTIGVSVVARVLLDAGYRVGVIAQPDIDNGEDIGRLGEPRLFWGVSAGSLDSMVANYTASGKRRKQDDLTPGGLNTRRPDRACIVYSQLIRRHFKQTCPIVLGGIEASLRRISHYDVWSDSVRRSILFDAKAEYLLYGMAEHSILELAGKLKRKEKINHIRGLCYISVLAPEPADESGGSGLELPSHQEVSSSKALFSQMFTTFAHQTNPRTARPIFQKQDTRYLVHNPPQLPMTEHDLDQIYELPYTRQVHPYYSRHGSTAAMETIRFSLTTHRGCYGQCRFCAIAVHQGSRIVSRSQASLLREAQAMTRHEDFKGIISDVGGPTANMYGTDCTRHPSKAECNRSGCLFPTPCQRLKVDHRPQIQLLKALRGLPGVRKVFIASGIRYDLIVQDRVSGQAYLEEILAYHVSGQLKIAPEHGKPFVLKLMGKPDRTILESFMALFDKINRAMPKKVFLTYYLMAAHPGCTLEDMAWLRSYALRQLKMLPEQVQIFTPTPATYSTLMYYTQTDPFSGQNIFVEKSLKGKQKQKTTMASKPSR